MKKGKTHVQLASHKSNDRKKKFLKDKSSKPQFKKKLSDKPRPPQVYEIGESSRLKQKFNGKCKFYNVFGHKHSSCYKFENWLEKKKRGNPITLVCFESNLVDDPSDTQ